MSEPFKALVLRQNEQQQTTHQIETLHDSDLPQGDVLLKVDYSSINYKDSMAVTGSGKIVLTWPMVPGIDLAGTVIDSQSERFRRGDQVVLTGWSVGEKYWGGYSQRQRVRAEWLAKLPAELSTQQAMIIGTAGLTAMLCVMALEDGGLSPDRGVIAVSGATGGVGSIAVALLSALGYRVCAISGKPAEQEFLRALGATDIIGREEMSSTCRPLEKQRWAGAIDTVGDQLLARLLAETDYDGTVAACGLAGGYKLPTTVMPFILRNVRLQGVDSVMCPAPRRQQAWQRLAQDLPAAALSAVTRCVALEEVPQIAAAMMAGKTTGRYIVDLNA